MTDNTQHVKTQQTKIIKSEVEHILILKSKWSHM